MRTPGGRRLLGNPDRPGLTQRRRDETWLYIQGDLALASRSRQSTDERIFC